jgi:hypothetical protein
MTRWFTPEAHSDPHKPAPLGSSALACIGAYVVGAVVGWVLVGVLAALVLR